MPPARMRLGAGITCVALAGTIGALGMLGHRRDGLLASFMHGGWLLGPRLPEGAATVAGVLIHLAWITLWSVLFAALVQRDRRGRASLFAAIVAAIAFIVLLLVPASLGGPLATLSMSERVLLHVVLAVSLALGMRLAPRG